MIRCELCGRIYDGPQERAQIRGHMYHCRIPQARAKSETQLTAAQDTLAQAEAEKQPSPRAQKATKARRERVPLGTPRTKLTDDAGSGKVGRYVIDRGTRVQDALNGGYEHVRDESGQKIRKGAGTADNGEPQHYYFMAIDKDLYEEDQREKQAELDIVEKQIYSGTLESKPEDRRYNAGITVSTDRMPPA